MQLQDLFPNRGEQVSETHKRRCPTATIGIPPMLVQLGKLVLKLGPDQVVVVKVQWGVQGAVAAMDEGWAPESRGNGLVHGVDGGEASSTPLVHESRVVGGSVGAATRGAVLVHAGGVDGGCELHEDGVEVLACWCLVSSFVGTDYTAAGTYSSHQTCTKPAAAGCT